MNANTHKIACRVAFLMFLITASVFAAPFAKKIQFTQPDGTKIELWGEGDEFYAVFETLDGYTVVFDPQTKSYHYAQRSADGNNLISAGAEVGKRGPAALGLARHVRIKPEAVKKRAFERFQRWDQAMQVSTRWKAMKGGRRQAELAAEGQGGSSGLQPSPPGSTTTGTKVGLCLLIDFSDDPATVPQAEIVDFCNDDDYTGDGNNGSVKKYYLDNSNNLLTYTNVVTIYIRAPQLKTYYNDTSQDCGQQARLLITNAIAVMKALPNYATEILPTFNALTVDGSNNVVAFNVFYAGGNGGVWMYGLWPHSWSLADPIELSSGGKKVYGYQISNIGSALEIGTFCHENGHMLCGFPDIYDYDYDSWGGAGFFCLMDYGCSGGDPDGSNPVQICAYLKRAAGWANVIDLASTSNLTATVTAAPTAGYNNYYRYRKPGVSTEYFLVENRQQTGHDASIPAAGVAVWHIDELGDGNNQSLDPNTNHANYEVTLVQADNLWHFEYYEYLYDANDLYYAGNSASAYTNRLDDSSSPNAHWWDGTSSGINFHDFSASGSTMTFIVGNPIAPTLVVTPASGLVSSGTLGGPFSPSNQVYGLTNSGSDSLNWSASCTQNWVTLSATNGTLAAGDSTTATVSINTNANSLAAGFYSDTVTFTNTTNGIGTTNRAVSLTVNLPPWQQWQLNYFNCTNCPQAADSADPDSDSQNNLTEFLAGTDPTNSISYWRIQASPTNGLPPLMVSFTDNSTGSSITNRFWNFGDGGASSGANPSHTYTNLGTFSVDLTIFNVYGTATLVASNLITVSSVATWTNANVSGNWSEASSWNPVSIPDYGHSVIFASAGATAVVDNVSRTISNITFSRSSNFYVTASGMATLTINNGITVTTNFTYTISAPVVLGGTNTWSVTSNGTLQVSGAVSGANPVTKTGSGTLILSGTNSYSAGTTVSNGTLKVTGTGLITNTASIDIASGATLDVSGRAGGSMTLVSGQTLKGGGTVQGNLILADGSILSPGSSVGTLTFLNDLVVSNAAVLQYDLGTNSPPTGGTAVSSNLTLGGTLNINDAGGFTTGVYTLVTCGGTLTYNGVTIGTTPNTNFTYMIDTNTAGQVKLNVVPPSATIDIVAADLRDQSGDLMPTSSVAVLVVDTATNGFVDPQPSFPLSLGATWGTDDKIVGLWAVDCAGQLGGVLCAQTVVSYTDGIASGQQLQLYWFPSLTLASNTVGVTSYGKYTDTNSPPLDGSDVWEMPAGGSSVHLWFITASEGGQNPDAAGRATLLTAEPLVANFAASPTNGVPPLAVTFTDTSTGTITNRFWDFGDSSTSNTMATSLSYTYGAGTYTVTLIVSGPGGVSTNIQLNYITALTPFAAWQQQYFGCTDCPQAAETADPDGDGQNNLAEFLAGTNPTNSMSGLRIISVVPQDNDVAITWTTAGSRTNAVQATAGDVEGGYTTNFIDISGPIIISGSGGTTTNYVDGGGATNVPTRFYRVRLVP